MFTNSVIRFAFICIFIEALSVGLIIPTLPALLGVITSTPQRQTIWYSSIMIAFGLTQFIFTPILGHLSDKFGRRPVLLIGTLGLGITYLIPAMSNDPFSILLSRCIAGFLAANIVVAQACITDQTLPEKRTEYFGKMGATFGVAFIFGPAIGGLLGRISLHLPFYCASILSFLNFIIGFFSLPLRRKNNTPTLTLPQKLNPFSPLISMLKNSQLAPLLIAIFFYTLSQSIIQVTWAIYTENRYQWSSADIGCSLFLLGATITCIQAILLPKLLRHFASKTICLLALLTALISLIGIAFSTQGVTAILFLCTFASIGMTGPILQGAISQLSHREQQGSHLGVIASLSSLTRAISPFLGAPLLLYTHTNSTSYLAGLPYLVGALLLCFAFTMIYRTHKLPQKKSGESIINSSDLINS